MRRVREWFEGWRDLQRSWSAGRKEYERAVQMRRGIEEEIARVEKLRTEVREAHSQVPGALEKIRAEVEQMGEQNRQQLELVEELRQKNLTADEIKKVIEKMDKTGAQKPDLGPLLGLVEKVKQPKD